MSMFSMYAQYFVGMLARLMSKYTKVSSPWTALNNL